MKVRELMIGDLVYSPKLQKVFKVTGIRDSHEEIESSSCHVPMRMLDPIPLSDEILKANGFEDKIEKARYGSVFYGLFVGNVSITFEVDNCLPILTIENTTDRSSQHNVICLKDEIYNVHELQHALRLCGLTELADNFKVV